MAPETYVMIGQRLGYTSPQQNEEPMATIGELSRMLTALRNRLLDVPAGAGIS
jgi:hypothetical protein